MSHILSSHVSHSLTSKPSLLLHTYNQTINKPTLLFMRRRASFPPPLSPSWLPLTHALSLLRKISLLHTHLNEIIYFISSLFGHSVYATTHILIQRHPRSSLPPSPPPSPSSLPPGDKVCCTFCTIIAVSEPPRKSTPHHAGCRRLGDVYSLVCRGRGREKRKCFVS